MIDGRWNRTQFYISSHPKVFCKKDVLRNSAKFTEKYLCQSLFFNKVADLKPATLFEKRLWHRCFLVNFTKFLRTPFLQNTSGRLILQSLIFYKAAAGACNFTKKETLAQVFSCRISEIFKNTFFTEHLQWLLLYSP